MMDGVAFGGLLMLSLGLIVPIGVIIIVVVILVRARRNAEKAVRSPEEYWEQQRAQGDPRIRELDRRLATGEITQEEYEHLRAEIERR